MFVQLYDQARDLEITRADKKYACIIISVWYILPFLFVFISGRKATSSRHFCWVGLLEDFFFTLQGAQGGIKWYIQRSTTRLRGAVVVCQWLCVSQLVGDIKCSA